jgi:hypothetical protein
MTLYFAARALHILGGLGMFMALGVELAGTAALATARTADQVRRALAVHRINARLGPFILALVLIPGIYLAMQWGGPWWTRLSFLALLVILILGGAVSRRRMVALAKSLPAGPASDEPLSLEIERRVQDPVLRGSLTVRAFLVLGIVVLMTTKPQLGGSLAVMGVALLLAAVLTMVRAPSGHNRSLGTDATESRRRRSSV